MKTTLKIGREGVALSVLMVHTPPKSRAGGISRAGPLVLLVAIEGRQKRAPTSARKQREKNGHASEASRPRLGGRHRPACRGGHGSCRRGHLYSALHLSDRPLRRIGHSDRQRHGGLSEHAERARWRHRRRQA